MMAIWRRGNPKRTPKGERHRIFGQQFTTDDKETVTFERWRIRQLLDQMDALKGETSALRKVNGAAKENKWGSFHPHASHCPLGLVVAGGTIHS
jgi:hypothetical protein